MRELREEIEARRRIFSKRINVMFGSRKFEGKCKGKKIQRKNRKKIKNRLKVNNFFFLLLQIHFIYFNSSI